MSMTLSVTEAQGKLAQLLELAQAGHEVIIQDPQKGKARLVPVVAPAKLGPRIFGLHEGEIWMSDDFNAPLPDSFWLGEKAG
ncbi:MAG: type II toxin-antitoxin system Phd/YefM family antitoxin [Verrucomicrobia bacterium]|nr:type II toxin-antitoxin system Phd/YefM family antitoxin [Verrucomicrobiota bacterium]